MEMPEKLDDHEKATLLMYMEQVGLPPWGGSKADVQIQVLMALCDWGKDRAENAFKEAQSKGYASNEQR